jgi:muramidase (phage lysozyme)
MPLGGTAFGTSVEQGTARPDVTAAPLDPDAGLEDPVPAPWAGDDGEHNTPDEADDLAGFQVAAARGQDRRRATQLSREHIDQLGEYLKHPNVQAFLSTLARAEGATYDSLYGDRLEGRRRSFSDFSRYPRTYAQNRKLTNHPAGRYQITPDTYRSLSQKLGLSDFSPRTQDLMAAQLLVQRGAMPHLLAGNFDAALAPAAQEWRALPQGPDLPNVTPPRQRYLPYDQLRSFFDLVRSP